MTEIADMRHVNEWVEAAKSGDRHAFESLYRAFGDRIYNLIAQLTRDEALAEDLTQATFVRAWERLPRLRNAEAFTVWLHQIARNQARDALRRRKREATSGAVDADSSLLEETVEGTREGRPDELLIAVEMCALVREAVADLPEHHREVVVMHHLNEMSVKEIAAILDQPLGTILSRLSRARDTLKRRLQWVMPEGEDKP